MDNKTVLQKIATGDFSGGGILNPKQSEKFLNFVIDQSVLKNNARMILMNEPIMEIDRIGVGNRVAKAKTEGVAPVSGDFVAVTTDKIELITKQIIVPRKITWDTMQDNIERENFEDTMLAMIASQLANDLEELFITGDLLSGDPYLALMDGWMELMSLGGHNVVSGLVPLTKTVFSKLKKALPNKYLRNMADIRFYVGPNNLQDYRDSLASRDTNGGDQALAGESSLTVFGIPVIEVPLMPVNTVILTHKNNLIVGMHKSKIRLEKDKDIYTAENLYALHLRAACQIENTDAIAYTTDLVELP